MDESAAIKSSEEEEPMPASSSSPQQYDEKYSQSLIDQEALLLTQLPPPSANNDDTLFFCNTQSSSMMPYSESQCSQQQQLLMLATQHPTTNDFNGNDSDEGDEDSLMQTQFFGSCNDLDENYHDGAQVSSQQPLLTTAAQPTITKINTRIADDYDVIMGSKAQQPSGTQLGHDISMAQHGYYIDKLSKQYLDNGEHYENNNDDNNKSDMLSFPTLEQRPTTTNEQELEFLYYTQQQQQQQQQHGEGNDENKCEEDYYDDDSNHDNDDDLERIVEEQNLAVSLSMEVIESVEKNGSQTSSSIENKKEEPEYLLRNKDEAKLESKGDDDTNDEDNNYGGYEHHVEQHSTGSAVMPSSAFGFVNAGSGKAITVNDEEMARATKMLVEDGDTNIIVAKFDEHKVEQRLSGAAVMPSPAFGFVSAGSGKAITVNDEEMARATKMLAEDGDTNIIVAKFDEHKVEQRLSGAAVMPSPAFGFVSAGSGKAITVNDEEMARATKMLAEDGDTNIIVAKFDEHKVEQRLSGAAVMPSPAFGFVSAGSGKAITVNDEEMARATKMLAEDGDTNIIVAKFDEHKVEQRLSGAAVMPSSAFGFVNAGSGKEITINDEEMAKATKMLVDDGDTNIIVAKFDEHKVEQRLSGAAVMPSPAFGFVSAGSGKEITITDEEMAKAAKIVVDDVDKYNDTTPASVSALVVSTKMTSKINQQSQEEKLSTVMNPYAKKRSLDQISKGGIGNPAAVTNSIASLASTQSRKLVINPYTKTAQKPKSVVRNPYAKVPNETSTTAGLSSVIPPAPKGGIITNAIQSLDKDSNNKTGKSFFDVSSVKLPKPKAEISFRLKGISFSLPLAERLPSRNVSYKPAEILTVSELYQYLYGANATTANCFKEMQSVRITGTLLCVSTSTSDENDGSKGDLYSTGTFLLIGDPLEKNRFPTKPLPPTQQHSSSHSTNGNISIPHTAATKSRPTSILKNKHTPILRTSQPALSSITTGQPITTTPAADGSTQTHESNTATKNPILRGGLLNNNNPKKFVYNGSKNRSSFGGGLHRKFVTPKRVATLTATNTGSSIMRKLSLVKSVSVSRGSSDVKIETIIQRHPAPLVPVWIGSSLDDDGLDDSVVNDFVMVMGEIVVEHCSSCQERNENGAVGANEAHSDVSSKSIEEDEDEGAENDGLPSSNEENLQAAVIRSVRDAALSIAACTWRNADSRSQSTQQEIAGRAEKKQFCSNCVCFLSARIVKNANGTDMNLQKESLKVRREYFKRRKEQMEGLLQGMLTNHVFSVGCGPYF